MKSAVKWNWILDRLLLNTSEKDTLIYLHPLTRPKLARLYPSSIFGYLYFADILSWHFHQEEISFGVVIGKSADNSATPCVRISQVHYGPVVVTYEMYTDRPAKRQPTVVTTFATEILAKSAFCPSERSPSLRQGKISRLCVARRTGLSQHRWVCR